jgi:transposase-like protein
MPEQQTKPKKLTMVQQSIEAARNAPAFSAEMQAQLDALVSAPITADHINDLTARLKRAIIERALNAEMSLHLGYAPGEDKPAGVANHRNGSSGKTLLTDTGPLRIDIPRDRTGTFEPLIVPKHGRRYEGFDELILSMYARGVSVRDIRAHLIEMYHVEVSPDFISTVTDEVMAEVTAWQTRPLEPMYPVIFFDALRVKIRDDGLVRNKAIYLALGILPDGSRDILGLWIEHTEGAKFWLKVFNDLKTRGVEDVLIAVSDGLKGIPESLAAAYPEAVLQTCIVHLIRNSLDYASWKDRKAVAAALRPIYTAPSAEASDAALTAFEQSEWGAKLPHVAAAWRRAWDYVTPFFAFPPEIRRVIYTTNAIESVNARIRKVIKTRGHFPNDEAATKLIWLALRNITKEWAKPVFHWKAAMVQFAIQFGDRFTKRVA